MDTTDMKQQAAESPEATPHLINMIDEVEKGDGKRGDISALKKNKATPDLRRMR